VKSFSEKNLTTASANFIMVEKLICTMKKRSKKYPLFSESGTVQARNMALLKGTLEYKQ